MMPDSYKSTVIEKQLVKYLVDHTLNYMYIYIYTILSIYILSQSTIFQQRDDKIKTQTEKKN